MDDPINVILIKMVKAEATENEKPVSVKNPTILRSVTPTPIGRNVIEPRIIEEYMIRVDNKKFTSNPKAKNPK